MLLLACGALMWALAVGSVFAVPGFFSFGGGAFPHT